MSPRRHEPQKTSRTPAEPSRAAAPGRTTLLHLLLLSGVSFALYAETLGNGFVIDDKYEVVNNRLIRSFANVPTLFAHSTWFFAGAKTDNYYRPLKLLAYTIEYRLFGFQPAYWHLANVLFNLAVVLVIYLLVRDLAWGGSAKELAAWMPSVTDGAGLPGKSTGTQEARKAAATLAFWTALLFAFHPIHVEAVVWVAGGSDLLCGLMLLLSLWLYHRACLPRHEDSSGHLRRVGAGASNPACGGRAAPTALLLYVLSVVAFFAGLLFKETALTFPAVILAYHFFYRGESLREMLRGWLRYVVYFAALAGYFALRIHALRGFAPGTNQFHLTAKEMVLSVPVLALKYLWKALAPVNLNFWHIYHPVRALGWKPAGAVVPLLVLVGAMFWLRPVPSGTGLRRREPLLSFALAWFWLTLIPVLDIPKVGIQVFTERYLYIPSLGFCIFVACAWLSLRDRASRPILRGAAYASLLALLAFYSAIILRRLPYWHDDFRLVMRTAEQSPNAAPVQSHVGVLYKEMGNLPAALDHLGRAVSLAPGDPYLRNNLASLFLSMGRNDDAIGQLQTTVGLNPTAPPFWLNLCTAYNAKREWDHAIEACRRGLALDPNNPRDPFNYDLLAQLGLTEWKSGQHDEALATYRRAIQLDPNRLEGRFYLAISLADINQLDAAADELLAALRTDPDSPDAYLAHYELGGIYQIKQRWQDAAEQYQQAAQENPGYAPARVQLQAVRARLAAPGR